MKYTLSASICVLAFASAAQGSLLSKLLGNLNVQISACPELSIGTSGKTVPGGKAQTQSSNPACPNYVPPGAVQAEDSSSSSEASESQENSSIASDGIDAAQSSPAWSLTFSDAHIAPALPVPSAEMPTDPTPPASSPAYRLSPIPELLPTPTNKDLLADKVLVEPLQTMATSSQRRPKCSHLAQTPENADVIIQGLPVASNILPAPPAMQVIPATPAMQAMPATPAMPVMPANPEWAEWTEIIWDQAAPPQQPAAEWARFTAPMAPPAPTVAGQFVAQAAANTITFSIPDGANGVVFETRNVGAYQFSD
ncbi:hypothetical protein IWW50_005543 [Coemansia erecta]|nr:hypothetical protein GGF43_002143 [Coemansia sp. RSA 2618]KAJ2819200.1 hypothetical protein IWW50_005543 [Coemansia erecta]